jgi:SAM-dependent methyltransferase
MSTPAANLHGEIYAGVRTDSPERLSFTQKAFQLLPGLSKPMIVDIGCGDGGPTVELARLSDGCVVGVDVDGGALQDLRRRALRSGCGDRVFAVKGSIRHACFGEESLDVVWAEGSIHIVGFEKGLQAWRDAIRPEGFLVVHEMAWLRPNPPREILEYWKGLYPGIRTTSEYLRDIPALGYDVIGHFELPEGFWLTDYFEPLERRLNELRERYASNSEALRVLDREQRSVDLYRRCSKWYGSAFFAMTKSEVRRKA